MDVRVLPRTDGSVGVAAGDIVLVDGSAASPAGASRSWVRAGASCRRGAEPPSIRSRGRSRRSPTSPRRRLPAIQAKLDQLASALVTEFNQIHRAGLHAAGRDERRLLRSRGHDRIHDQALRRAHRVVRQPRGLRQRRARGTATSPRSSPGSRRAGVASLGGSTFREHFVSLAAGSRAGRRRAACRTPTSQQTLVERDDAARTATSGVNVDEEMINLIASQQAYSGRGAARHRGRPDGAAAAADHVDRRPRRGRRAQRVRRQAGRRRRKPRRARLGVERAAGALRERARHGRARARARRPSRVRDEGLEGPLVQVGRQAGPVVLDRDLDTVLHRPRRRCGSRLARRRPPAWRSSPARAATWRRSAAGIAPRAGPARPRARARPRGIPPAAAAAPARPRALRAPASGRTRSSRCDLGEPFLRDGRPARPPRRGRSAGAGRSPASARRSRGGGPGRASACARATSDPPPRGPPWRGRAPAARGGAEIGGTGSRRGLSAARPRGFRVARRIYRGPAGGAPVRAIAA